MSPCRFAGALLALLLLQLPTAHGGFVQSYQAAGNLGLYSAAVSSNQVSSISGSFDLSQIPIGSTIQKAFLYSADWWQGAQPQLQLTINTLPVAAVPSTASDTPIGPLNFATLTSYRWDLTTALSVLPPAPFNFNITSTNSNPQLTAAALMIVWSDPTAPTSTVTIVDGAQQVGELTQTVPPTSDTESINFTGLPAGPTALSLFTVSDDQFGTGETVRYNGGTDHGPLDGNLGGVASLLQFNETSLAGSNNLTITSSQDYFGWIASASVVTPATVVPEPGSLALVVMGSLCGLAGCRRRRRV